MAKQLIASNVADKWKRNYAASAESVRQGVMAVTVAPTELAARQADRALAGYREAIESGRWAANLRKVGLEDWKQSMLTTGLNRMASGATTGQPKMERFMNRWLPIMARASEQVKGMPKGTIDDALARIRVVLEAGKSYKGASV